MDAWDRTLDGHRRASMRIVDGRLIDRVANDLMRTAASWLDTHDRASVRRVLLQILLAID
jgi:hypothetical protein